MGRFSSDTIEANPVSNNGIASYSTNQYKPQGGMSQGPTEEQMRLQEMQASWPQVFPKSIIGLDRDGVINFDRGHYLTKIEEWEPIPGSLEAIRMMRLKGYKVVLIMDEAGKTQNQVDAKNQQMMSDFGNAGIMSIETMYYSVGTEKSDIYVKPSTGMFKRCEQENPHIKFKGGWYVGRNVNDAKVAFKVNAKCALINPSEEELKKLNSFSNQKVKKRTRIFQSLQEFEKTLK